MRAVFDHAFLGRGFRPFFLMGAAYAAVGVILWTMQISGAEYLHSPFSDPVLWHAHEMIYGFTVAIIAGFLLTAVTNWTGIDTAKNGRLAFLCILWLAGRAGMNLAAIPYGLAAVLDLAFLPALALTLSIPLLRTGSKRNFVFLVILAVLFFCDLYVWIYQDRLALYVAIMVIMAIVSVIGGRIIPFFITAALRRKGIDVKQTGQPKTDLVALILLGSVALSLVFTGIESTTTGILALLAALVHLWRHRHYHFLSVWRDPMLWSLHLGHLWLIAGLIFLAAATLGLIPLSPALHALTVGTIGTMTLSMMCRVSLGHTGREIAAGPATVLAFILVQAAALARVLGPAFWPDNYMLWIHLSGGLWALAFAIFTLFYAAILWQRRPDNLPA